MRRMLAVSVTLLLVAGVFASPAFAQTNAEQEMPYSEKEVEEEVEEPDVLDQVEEVEGVVETAPEPEAERAEPDTTTVLGITLQRTGANALLLGAIGLLVLGLGGFLVMRTRRDTTQA